jgi:hypothetical protein
MRDLGRKAGLYVVMTQAPSPEGEFVELEDERGCGVGLESGIHWQQEEDGYWLLGPFAPADEIERLREALRRIAEHEEYFGSGPPDDEMREIARAALAEGEQ